jgi:hypothetical protein
MFNPNSSSIDEKYLDGLIDNLGKSQMALLQDKTDDPEKQNDITKQLTGLNSLLTAAMRLRNVLRKIKK